MANILIDKYEKEIKDYFTRLKSLPLISDLANKYKLLEVVQESQDNYQKDQGTRFPALYFFILANEIKILKQLETGLAKYRSKANKSAYNNLERSLFLGDKNQVIAFIFQLIVYNNIEHVCESVDFKTGNGNHDVDFLIRNGNITACVETCSTHNFEWYDNQLTASLRGKPELVAFDGSSYSRKIQSTIADKHGQLRIGNENILILCTSGLSISDQTIEIAINAIYDFDQQVLELLANRGVEDPTRYIQSLKQIVVFRYLDRKFSYYSCSPFDDLNKYGLELLTNI